MSVGRSVRRLVRPLVGNAFVKIDKKRPFTAWTRKKEGQGGRRNKEERGTRRKEGRGVRSDEESEKMRKLLKEMKNEKLTRGRIVDPRGLV